MAAGARSTLWPPSQGEALQWLCGPSALKPEAREAFQLHLTLWTEGGGIGPQRETEALQLLEDDIDVDPVKVHVLHYYMGSIAPASATVDMKMFPRDGK